MPGVVPERIAEGMKVRVGKRVGSWHECAIFCTRCWCTSHTHLSSFQIRHCALSLVGEPIMYPEINALVSELHKWVA